MDFEEYLDLQSKAFVQYYRCRPTSRLNKGNIIDEDGNKVVLPPSALDRLSSLVVEFPMQFQIKNPRAADRASHVGVLEFVADEGFIYTPAWLMAHLGLADNDLVLVRQTALPKATFVKLRPHTTDFTTVSNPRDLLEYNFHKYACLTAGETITVTEGDRWYRLDVLEAEPGGAVCVIETDCEVGFATPLDYVEPQPPSSKVPRTDNEPVRFTGVAARMDCEPVEQPKTPAAAAGAPSNKTPKAGLRFGGASAVAGSGGLGGAKMEVGGGKEEQRFTGTGYSLQ